VWNHWYTVRFNVDEDYLRRQVAAMDAYGFDYFVVDAGWYEACGRWVPDAKKFPAGSFETLLAEAKQKGPKLGIWTCPQFVQANAEQLPDEVDRPGFFERFINGHLLDLVGCDFRKRLLEHVAMLRERYHADWWKYDQILFTGKTRQGVMRNVLAFQEALEAVRKAQPDLYIESCQSGGRMINEITVPIAQGQWLRDGSGTGLAHARGNFAEALGALEFLPPHTAARWMNRPYDNDPDDDTLTRMYCRSCMVGTWGLVADLSRIADRQRQVILDEVKHYRRLNPYKTCTYDLYPARSGKPFAGVVFYAVDGRAAGVLLARVDDGPFEAVLPLGGLADGPAYRVEDVDQAASSEQSAAAVRQEGLRVSFPAERLSALVFVEPTEPTRP
jgi:alpha-galactosidase